MYEILTETVPYEDIDIDKMTPFAFFNKVVSEKIRPEFKVPIKESFRQLITQCWSDKPENRPSFEEIYSKLTPSNNNPDDKEPKYFLSDVDEEEVLTYIEKRR